MTPGIQGAMQTGVLAGYNVVDVQSYTVMTVPTTKLTRLKWRLRSLHPWRLKKV